MACAPLWLARRRGFDSPLALALRLACPRLQAVPRQLNWRLCAAPRTAIAKHAGLPALRCGQESLALWTQQPSSVPLTPTDGSTTPDDMLRVRTAGTTGAPNGAMYTQAAMLAPIDAAVAVQT